METAVRPLLDLVDHLRSHGIEDELSLPQVCELIGSSYLSERCGNDIFISLIMWE